MIEPVPHQFLVEKCSKDGGCPTSQEEPLPYFREMLPHVVWVDIRTQRSNRCGKKSWEIFSYDLEILETKLKEGTGVVVCEHMGRLIE